MKTVSFLIAFVLLLGFIVFATYKKYEVGQGVEFEETTQPQLYQCDKCQYDEKSLKFCEVCYWK